LAKPTTMQKSTAGSSGRSWCRCSTAG
jgi:hypothetical protein